LTPSAWKTGDRVFHRFNPDLGAGRVVTVEGRMLEVEFPAADTRLRLTADSDALAPLELRAGQRVRLEPSGEPARLARRREDGGWELEDGRVAAEPDLWPLEVGETPLDRLAWGDVDPLEEFANRLDALHLLTQREAEGLGSFLGGRIRLFPHQLHAAERAARSEPVRWLLADEVGLGKTVEACLILNRLVHAKRAERILVVAPETLTVQWLGELWRKYHQVFVLLDDTRLADVSRVYGAGFNPFDAHRRAIVGLETLVENRRLTEQAVEAGIDLLVMDEAHHLRRPAGHPGNPAYRAVEPIARLGRHVLLLTATPLEEDTHGFLRLLQLLRPEDLPEEILLTERLSQRRPLPPCTSATRRADIGGLPPRVHRPADLDDEKGWTALDEMVELIRGTPAEGPLARKTKAERIRRALASAAALAAVVPVAETRVHTAAARASDSDPRVAWLAAQAAGWKAAGEKTLIFVAHRESLVALKAALEPVARVRAGVFHEDLSPGQRDIEVAQFRLPDGPSLLISTECGGEGRNFEFCRRLVLFDLPWNPMTVEQRIGRLDRIGRREPVEIVTFRPPGGLGAAVARLHEELGLYREPLGGLERELAMVEPAVSEAALDPDGPIDPARFLPLIREVRAARERVRDAAYHELHREPYRPEMAESILARVPDGLDGLNADVILEACRRLGFDVERQRGKATWMIEFGPRALVDHLPGVPAGSRFLGTFDRAEAVEKETLDYFATGHPLVEGVLAELEESPRGRVALLELTTRDEPGFGLLGIYRDGPAFTAVAVDSSGRERPEWAARLMRRPLRTRRVDTLEWTGRKGWREMVLRLVPALRGRGRPVAVAAVRMVAREGRSAPG
jgi:ATP-dependent helicase HepA